MFIDANTKALKLHSKLLEVLGEIDRPGNACPSSDRPLTMPSLEVAGLNSVGLPLSKSDACKLIRLCRQAPHGKATETIVDTDVRRVWELDPKKLRLNKPMWDPGSCESFEPQTASSCVCRRMRRIVAPVGIVRNRFR